MLLGPGGLSFPLDKIRKLDGKVAEGSSSPVERIWQVILPCTLCKMESGCAPRVDLSGSPSCPDFVPGAQNQLLLGESGEYAGVKGQGRGVQMAARMPLFMLMISPVPASRKDLGLLKILKHT